MHDIERLARLLMKAAAEHGWARNSFSPSELTSNIHRRMMFGLIGKRHLQALNDGLKQLGADGYVEAYRPRLGTREKNNSFWTEQTEAAMVREAEAAQCPACPGEGEALGTLGNRFHFRCRSCGIDFSKEQR